MKDDLFPRRRRRRQVDLNIVPILDMLTTVIFFLLLSTSFMEYTKLTLPPSSTSVITDPVVPPPVAPKMLIYPWKDGLKVALSWSGLKPGETSEIVKDPATEARRLEIIKASQKLVKEFIEKFPTEKTLQIGLGAKVPYQVLVAGMDGVRELMPDLVLISPSEVEARMRENP